MYKSKPLSNRLALPRDDFVYFFACWGIFHAFLSTVDFFLIKINRFINNLSGTLPENIGPEPRVLNVGFVFANVISRRQNSALAKKELNESSYSV